AGSHHGNDREPNMNDDKRWKLTRRQTLPLLGAGLLAGGLLSRPGLAQGEAPTGNEAFPYLNGLPKEERLAVLEREAQREGGVVLYGATGIDKANEFLNLFRARYPGVGAEFVRLTDSELVERLL